MKNVFLIILLILVGCKAAEKGGDKSYFDKNHTPFMELPIKANVVTVDHSYNSMTIVWGDSDRVDNYTLKYKLHSDATYTTVSTNATSPYTLVSLSTNTMYDFIIIAKNQMGEVSSDVISAWTLASAVSPVASTISVASFDEGVQEIIDLPYATTGLDFATSCEIINPIKVHVTRSCQCDVAGDCNVGVTSDPQSFGAGTFQYRILINNLASGYETVSFNINPVNDGPSISTIADVSTNEDVLTSVNFTMSDPDSVIECSSSYLSATSSNSVLIPVSQVSFTGTYPNCTARFTPSADLSGTSNLVFTATDGALIATSNTFAVNVNAVNDSPVIGTIGTMATDENLAASINFTITDVDSVVSCGNSSITSTNTALVDTSSVVFSGTAPNCVMTVNPKLNQYGQAQITLNVTDGIVNSQNTFTLNVAQVNIVPTISFIANEAVSEGAIGIVNFTINDVDSVVACNASYLSMVSTNASLLLSTDVVFSGTAPNCTATINPLAHAFGSTNITITLTDGTLSTTSNTFNLTVAAVNDAPFIASILTPQVTNQGTLKVVNFTIGDIDSTIDCNTAVTGTSSDTTIVANSGIVIGGSYPNCQASITPVPGKNGPVNISLTVNDGSLTSTNSFSLVIVAVNAAPTISGLTNTTVNEDTPAVVSFTINDVDSNLTCTASNLSAVSSSTALVDNTGIIFGGTYPNCTVTISPIANQFGTTNITVSVTDGTLTIAAAPIVVTITAVNDVPTFGNVSSQTMNQDTVKIINFTINDVDGSLICSTAVSAASSSTTIISNAGVVIGGSYPNCTATVTPLAGKNGLVDISLTVNDGTLTNTTTFPLAITAVNAAPSISGLLGSTINEDATSVINFTINDVDSQLACSSSNLSATSSNASLVLSMDIIFSGTYPNCTATIHPLPNQYGTTNVTISVTDGTIISTGGPVILTVNAVNDAPTISSVNGQAMNQDTIKSVNFTINDIDSNINCSDVTGTSSNTSIIPDSNIFISGTYPNCTAAVTPLVGKNGSLNISLVVNDGSLTNTSAFSLAIAAVNIAPTLSNIVTPTMTEDTPGTVTFTIVDPDSTLDCTRSFVSATSTNSALIDPTTVTIGGTYPNCSATFAPVANQNGTSTVKILVTDGVVVTTSGPITLNVSAVNDAPAIAPISTLNLLLNQAGTASVNISDLDSTLSCNTALSATSSNTALVLSSAVTFSGSVPNCIATILPLHNQSGATNITISVTDGNTSVPAVFAVTFGSTYIPQVAANLTPVSISEDTEGMITLSYTNVQGDPATTCFIATTSHATVTTPCSCDVSGVCTVGITGANNYNGVANFTYNVTASNTVSNTATSTFTIMAVNDAPAISTVTGQSTSEDSAKVVSFILNDVDSSLTCAGSVTGTSSDTTIVSNANIIITGSIPNCTATITPIANQNGSTNITLTATDGTLTAISAFALSVSAVNDAPVMGAISAQATNEDAYVDVAFTINDMDSTLSCMGNVIANSSNTSLVAVSGIVITGNYPNCSARVSPEANVSGAVDITLLVNDGSLSDSKTFSLSIAGINDAPTISSVIAQSTNEDTAKGINFTINDIDSTLTCSGSVSGSSSVVGLVGAGNISITGAAPNCVATITPIANQNGSTNITLTVTDGALGGQSSFTLTVNAVNDAPTISAIPAQAITEDTLKTVNFTLNDVDSTITCSGSMIATSANDSIVLGSSVVFGGTYPNCTAVITPQANQSGVVNLTFTATDGSLTGSQSFNLTITAINDAPVIGTIAAQSTLEDTVETVNFTISDIDSTLTCSGSVAVSSSDTTMIPTNNIVISGTAPNCTATINPGTDQTGTANISLVVTDGVLTSQSTFAFTVTAVNDAPTMTLISNQTTNEDVSKVVSFTIHDVDSIVTCTGSIIANSSDITLVTNNGIIFGGTYPNCTATISPEANISGTTNLTFTVNDGALTSSQSFSLLINAVNDAPVISSIAAQTTDEDISKAVSFTINDIDSTLTCAGSVTVSSSNTALVGVNNVLVSGTAPNCIATINPLVNQSGTTLITLTVSDTSLTRQSLFALTVNAANDAPTITFITNDSFNEDTVKTINFTIGDVDSSILCSSSDLSVTSSNASVILSTDIVFGGTAPNCTATITSLPNQNGNSNIVISVTDGPSVTTSNTFIMTVNAVNDAPTMSTISAQSTNEDTAKGVNFTINDIDSNLTCSGSVTGASSDTSIVSSANISVNGTYPNCTATIVPTANMNGVVNLTFTVSDGQLSTATTFALTIAQVNDAPTISNIAGQSTNEDTALVVNFTINDIDSTLTCSGRVSGTSNNMAIVGSANVVVSGVYPNCTATINPLSNANGSVNVTLTVTDGALSATSVFALTVVAVDDAPVSTNIASSTLAEDIQSIITLPYTDVENDQATACFATSLSNVSITQACSCTAGVCTVGLTGTSNYNGTAGFSFNITANGAVSNTSTASLTITAVNDAPTIASISTQTTNEDTSVLINFTIADVDSTLTCIGSVSKSSSNTTIVPNSYITIGGTFPNCTATILPALNQNGAVNVTLTVTDGALSNSSVFALNITPVDDAPVVSNISSLTINEDVQKTVTLPYIDADGDQATSCILSGLNHITVTTPCSCALGACTAGITGTADYNGVAGFSFTVTSNSVVSNTGTANFTINAVNDAPTMAAVSAQSTLEDTSVSVNFTIADIDSTLTCGGSVTGTSSVTGTVSNSNIVITGTSPNCTATIAPTANQNGAVNITLTVSDSLLTAANTFALTIQPVMDISGSLTLSGVADTTYGRTLSFSNLTIDEAVSKAEVCISEDTNLNGSISAGEKCNTQTWIDITSVVGASGSTTPASWANYTIKQGVNGASFTQPLAVTCSSNRIYFTHLRLTNASSNTTEMTSASWKFWNPSCLSGTVGLWLDASDSATVFSNTACTTLPVSGTANGVKCWKDKSYNNLILKDTITTYPKYMATGFASSRPAIEFNGGQDIVLLFNNLVPKNIIAAVKVNVNDEGNTLIGNPGSETGIRLNGAGSWYSPFNAYNFSDFTYSAGASYVNGTSGASYTLATEHILYQTKGANSGTWGGVGIGGSEPTLLNLDQDRINADVGEIIMCTTDCSSSQTKLEGYLAHKWGTTGSLPAGHAYKTTPP